MKFSKLESALSTINKQSAYLFSLLLSKELGLMYDVKSYQKVFKHHDPPNWLH